MSQRECAGTVLGFASDYDGTLDFHRGGGISQADCDAIKAFQAQGGLFGVNTGRTPESLRRKVGDKVRFDFCVLVSGALVTDGADKVIWEQHVPRDVMTVLVRRFMLPTLGLYLIDGDRYWRASRLGRIFSRSDTVGFVRTLREIPDPVYGLSFLLPTKALARRVAQTINRDYGDSVTAYQNVVSVDVVPRGCSKATGLEIARRELGIDVMGAIGDSYNDLPMLQEADVSYTFGGSPQEVREAADVLVPTVGAALTDYTSKLPRWGQSPT